MSAHSGLLRLVRIGSVVALCWRAASAEARELSATLFPLAPYVEPTATGVAVNGDILVRNEGDTTYELAAIRLEARDSHGELIQRKELNANGTSPSILTVPDRRAGPHSTLVIYNPFYAFPASLGLARLDFSLEFTTAGQDSPEIVSVSGSVRKAPVTTFRLPVQGRILVWDGHDFYSHHRRWNYTLPSLRRAGYRGNAGRYAYDFISVDPSGRERTGPEANNESWLSFGKKVSAAASGTVVASVGDVPDDRTFHRSKNPNAIFGNHVVIREVDGSYTLYGHLMQGSVSVKAGNHVRAGQQIGRIGASGDSLFPHLHFQHADSPDDLGEGIPVRWIGVDRFVGHRRGPITNGSIDTGDIVISE